MLAQSSSSLLRFHKRIKSTTWCHGNPRSLVVQRLCISTTCVSAISDSNVGMGDTNVADEPHHCSQSGLGRTQGSYELQVLVGPRAPAGPAGVDVESGAYAASQGQ